MRDADGKWDGGYIRKDSKGRKVYVIRRMVRGKRYEVSTRATTTKGAMEQLARFEADPDKFTPSGAPVERLSLTETLRDEFLEWSEEQAKNTPKWVTEQRGYLKWWAGKLGDRDLRNVTLPGHILPALEGQGARGHRIAVLKRFYSWLVSEKHAIEPDEDPTYRKLRVPQARPEQWKRLKAITAQQYLALRPETPGHWRDGLDILAATGWHATELVRFVKSGTVKKHPMEEGVFLTCPQTKGGEPLNTGVNDDIGAAAKRLLRRGSFDMRKFYKVLKKASKKAKTGDVTPGIFRHSVATIAIGKGAHPAAVSAFLNHKDPRTTRRFYATHAIPVKVPTLTASELPTPSPRPESE